MSQALAAESRRPVEGGATWGVIAGRVLSGLAVLSLALDATMKVLTLAPAMEATVKIGYPASVVFPLGLIEVVCLVAYLVPSTSVFGAILWTGYLGGAVATHVRLQDPLFTHVLSGVYVATFLWVGLWLREPRLRALVPIRR